MTTVPQRQQSPTPRVSIDVDRIGEERVCGITRTIHHFPTSSYILKQTCSDFVVNEIGVDGTVVMKSEKVIDIERESRDEGEPEILDARVELGKLPISQDVVDDIITFKEGRDESYILPGAFELKEQRTSVHKTIKSLFHQEIVSETMEGHQIKLIRKSSRRKIDPRDGRKPPTCLMFIMQKEGTDTIGAIHTISRCLRISSRAFGYAGSKDKRAITTQLVTVRNCEFAKLAGFNKIPNKGITVSGIRVCEHPLQLGDLQGNRFVITLRDVNPTFDLQDRIHKIKSSGFINYFGLQRFGTQSVKTHIIGAHLLRGDWKQACAAILDPRHDEQGSMQAARLYWARTGNAAETITMLPSFAHAERQVLGHLVDAPNDFRGAIGAINRELRMMYVHAVQSYLWNRIVSEHLRQGELDKVVDIPGYDNVTGEFEPFLSELNLPPTCFSPTPQNETLWDLRGAKRGVLCHPRDLDATEVEKGVIQVSFSLPPSSYATMLLRELFGSE